MKTYWEIEHIKFKQNKQKDISEFNYKKQYRQEHKEEIKEYKQQWYLKHRKELSRRKKEYHQKHKKEILLKVKKYYQEHKEERNLYAKQYRQKHRKEILNYKNNKFNTDINYRLIVCLRGRLYQALKKNFKSGHTIELLGCSIEFLKGYLQKQFTAGMNWNNYGKWHIDHIKPCCSFDLSQKSEQYNCFNYKNLQPLWAIENIRKRKIDILYKNPLTK